MHVLYAEFTAKPGQEDEVARLIAEYADLVRREPGNDLFEVYTKLDTPREFFVLEKYTDVEAFERHVGAREGQLFNDRLRQHIQGEGSRLTTLQVLR